MTPLEFFISVKNSDAKNGLEEVQEKVNSFKESAEDLYEGPAREMKIRTELRGMVKDIAMGESPMAALINSFERLSEVARFAGPIAAALAVGFAISEQMREAAKSSGEFFELFQKGMEVSVKNSSQDALKELVKELDKAEEKYKKRGFLERLFFGSEGNQAMAGVRDQRAMALAQIDELETAKIEAHTKALRSMTDEELALEGEIASARLEYEEKIKQERAAGNDQAAIAYEEQMGAAIDRIQAKAAKAEKEKFAKQRDLIEQIDAENASSGTSDDKLASMRARAAKLQGKLDSGSIFDPDPDNQRYKDELELAKLKKEIVQEEKTVADAEAEKQKAAARELVDAAARSERLRQDVLKSQFAALDKEDKIIILRAAAARLEKELKMMVWSPDERMTREKSLSDADRQLAELSRGGNILKGLEADTALRGAMSANGFNRVTNDSAQRAEKQRDQMVGYLKTIAGQKLDLSQLDAF